MELTMKIDETKSMLVLASVLERKGKKFFSFARAERALLAVISEAGDSEKKSARAYVRAHTAASLAVIMQDWQKKARRERAREGFLMLLERLEEKATAAVFYYDPEGWWITRNFPEIAAKLGTPRKVYEAQAEATLTEEVTARTEATRTKRRATVSA